MAASATTLPAGQTPAEIADLLVHPVTRVGGYYMGDRLGMNIDLTLLAGGGYSMNWSGCQGLYGAAVGRWGLEDNRLLLEPSDQQGTLAEKPIRVLHIRLLADHSYPPNIILIPDDGMATFLQEGIRSDTCFLPRGLAGEAVYNDYSIR